MSSIMKFLRAWVMKEGDIKSSYGTMSVGPTNTTVLFTDRYDNPSVIDILPRSRDVEVPNTFYLFNTYIRDTITFDDTDDLSCAVLALCLASSIKDILHISPNKKVSVEFCGNGSFMVWAPVDDKATSAYYIGEDGLLIFTNRYTNKKKFREEVLSSVDYEVCKPLLCALPLMCYAAGYTNIWQKCKDFYKERIINCADVCKVMLDNYPEAGSALGSFKHVGLEPMRDYYKKMLDSIEDISSVSAGDYTLYKIKEHYVLTHKDGLMFYNYVLESDLSNDLKSMMPDVVESGSIDYSSVEVESASTETVKAVSRYLSHSKIRGSLNILNEIDRLLKLAGIPVGIDILADIVKDIDTQQEEK